MEKPGRAAESRLDPLHDARAGAAHLALQTTGHKSVTSSTSSFLRRINFQKRKCFPRDSIISSFLSFPALHLTFGDLFKPN